MASELLSEMKKPIHFFKIVTQILHQGKLMIPKKFVRKYGQGLPKSVFLKTPNGASWKLKLVKSDGKIWFEKGWKEFAEYHSLSHGHLLVFKYESTSHYFGVRIFDMSALEINYPKKIVEANNEEDRGASLKRKAFSSFEIGSSSRVKVGKSQKVAAADHTHKKPKKPKGKHVITATLERAKSLKTCNPSFVVVMGASYVEHHFLLSVPCQFGKRHFHLDQKRGYIYLQLLDNGRVWSVKYAMRMDTKRRFKFELTCGWKKFSMDNNLKIGDVCNFELIHSTNMTFQVHIFRETDKDNTQNCSTSQKSSQEAAQLMIEKRNENHHHHQD